MDVCSALVIKVYYDIQVIEGIVYSLKNTQQTAHFDQLWQV